MSRRFLTVGSILMLATASLWLAGALDWIQGDTADRWSGLTLKGAAAAFALALLLRIVSPLSSAMSQGRCTVCGRRTSRGHVYCLDHLQETVNVTRDRSRGGTPPRPGPRRQSRTRG